MKTLQLLSCSIAVGTLGFAATANAEAAQVASCSLLSLAQAGAIIGTPVTIFAPGSFAPTTRHGITTSNCTYLDRTGAAGSRGARVTLMWASNQLLVQSHDYYVRRHKESSSLKGDILVLASVTHPTPAGLGYDVPAGEKLLAAALQKL